MKTVTRKYQVFTFNELSEDAQTKAIEKERESENECLGDWLPNDMQEKCNELLKKHEIEGEPRVYYSLSYCQGDGAMFEGSFYWKGFSIVIKHEGRYNHENSKSIDMVKPLDDGGEEVSTDEEDEEFNKLYVSICKELAQWGYDLIESATSDEAIKEKLEDLKGDYLKDGTVFKS